MEKTLIILVGLPRSGKSTYARSLNVPIVNPDSIRLALHGQRFIAQTEPFVWATAQYMVHALFLAGHNEVVLDATNISRKRRDVWKSKNWKRKFTPIDVDKQTCIDRALQQNDQEIIPVIERMSLEYEPVTDDERDE